MCRGETLVAESSGTTSLAAYTYQPFPPEETYIRRLVLEKGTVDDPLNGRLETIKLEDASYEAISYVWGSSNGDQSIIVDGQCLPITSNMAQVLRQVRREDRPRALWADSICINQNGPVEKGRQVALMGQIYEESNCTWICLGVNPEHRRIAEATESLISDVNERIQRALDDPDFSWDWDSFPHPDLNDPLLGDPR